MVCLTGIANASLTHIGFAFYDDGIGNIGAYKMIYDDDSPLGPITWFDYSNEGDTWENQKAWAADLGNKLTYYWLSGYENFTWTEDDWRLPDVGQNPQRNLGITTSEMGHLYYDELGLDGIDANVPGHYPTPDYTTSADLNASVFYNLIAGGYYTQNTGDLPNSVWYFEMNTGWQGVSADYNRIYGLAVRGGVISTPVPGAVWLLGSGVLCLTGMSRRQNRKKV